MRRALVALVIVASAAPSTVALGLHELHPGTTEIRASLRAFLSDATRTEIAAGVGLWKFGAEQNPVAHDQAAGIEKLTRQIEDGAGYLGAVETDATTYQDEMAATPAAQRPPTAISEIHELEGLVAKAKRYDGSALALLKRLDAAYLSWEGNGSAARREEVVRLASQMSGDIERAESLKREALALADKLPPVPAAPAATAAKTCGQDNPYEVFIVTAGVGHIQTSFACNFPATRVVITVSGHTIDPGSVFPKSGLTACSGAGDTIDCSLAFGGSDYTTVGLRWWTPSVTWDFASTDHDSPQAANGQVNTCGVNVAFTFYYQGKQTYSKSQAAHTGTCP